MSKVTGSKRILAISLMVTLGSFSNLLMISAMAQPSARLAGEINVRGTVTLNGANAVSGATVLDAGMIKTANNGSAMINLGKSGQIEISPDSDFILKIDNNSIGGNLRSGHAVFSVPVGVKINVATPEGMAMSEGNEASVVTVDVACGKTQVSSAKSNIKVTSGERVEIVGAGQEVSVGTQNAQAPNCKRMAVVGASRGLAAGALAALLLAGIGGAIVGIVAVTQANDTTATSVNISGFRP